MFVMAVAFDPPSEKAIAYLSEEIDLGEAYAYEVTELETRTNADKGIMIRAFRIRVINLSTLEEFYFVGIHHKHRIVHKAMDRIRENHIIYIYHLKE